MRVLHSFSPTPSDLPVTLVLHSLPGARDAFGLTMALTLLDLPLEIRNEIYQNLLVVPCFVHLCPGDESASPRRADGAEPLDLWPAILRTTRSIRDEATPMLYSRNAFVLATADPWVCGLSEVRVVKGFLSVIGAENATYIRHVSVAFPIFSDYRSGHMALESYSEDVIRLFRDSCTGLVRLETEADRKLNMLEALLLRGGPQLVDEAVAVVDARFRTIPSLKHIVVNMFPQAGSGNPAMRDKMRGQGWAVCSIPEDQTELRHGHIRASQSGGFDEDDGEGEGSEEEDSEKEGSKRRTAKTMCIWNPGPRVGAMRLLGR